MNELVGVIVCDVVEVPVAVDVLDAVMEELEVADQDEVGVSVTEGVPVLVTDLVEV